MVQSDSSKIQQIGPPPASRSELSVKRKSLQRGICLRTAKHSRLLYSAKVGFSDQQIAATESIFKSCAHYDLTTCITALRTAAGMDQSCGLSEQAILSYETKSNIDRVSADFSLFLSNPELTTFKQLLLDLRDVSLIEQHSMLRPEDAQYLSHIVALKECTIKVLDILWRNTFRFTDDAISRGSNAESVVELAELGGNLSAYAQNYAERCKLYIVRPILHMSKGCGVSGPDLKELKLADTGQGLPAVELFVAFLAKLPAPLLAYLRPALIQELVTEIKISYLPGLLPMDVTRLDELNVIVDQVLSVERRLKDNALITSGDLTDWVDDVPSLWCGMKINNILCSCRSSLLQWNGATEVVKVLPLANSEQVGMDLDNSPSSVPENAMSKMDIDTINDDWAAADWDVDDNEVSEDLSTQSKEKTLAPADLPTTTSIPQPSLIPEKFVVSSLAQIINDICTGVDHTADELRKRGKNDRMSVILPKLQSAQLLVVDLYISLIPIIRLRTGLPRLLIYNDCLHIHRNTSGSDVIRLFGESCYAAEISDAYTKIADIMSGASGFVNCTNPEQMVRCNATIDTVVGFLKRQHERFESQLTATTTLTAFGSIVEAAIEFMTSDIIALTDISAAESAELARLGDVLGTVESYFINAADEPPLAAMWCPSWFKFRYLLDILEADLDYILDLWITGTLVDYTSSELTDLIRALFSDSMKRRSVIEAISSTTAT